MAGSYLHCVTKKSGKLLNNDEFPHMIENLGDAYEAIEEMYGMIWYLARGSEQAVTRAHQHYGEGLLMSPGIQKTRKEPT